MDNTFGELVHTKRNLFGYSMRELARKSNVDVAYISKIEKGQALNPNFSVVMRISKELGIDLEALQRVFELDEDLSSVISGSIRNSISGVEKEAVQGIVGEVVQITNSQEFDIERMGALLQKVYNLHQQKNKDLYYYVSVENNKWMNVLETNTDDRKLLGLYCSALEIDESDVIVMKGEIVQYPEYFNESSVLTIEKLFQQCESILSNDDLFEEYQELKDYLITHQTFFR
jgi:transcriptional regulator with XRE-family HTH domain